MENKEVSVGSRLGSMLLDHFILSFFITFLVAPFSLIGISESLSEESTEMVMKVNWALYVLMFGLSVYFNKDAIKGKSLAKRILKHEIIDIKTNEIANPFKCLVRNFFIIIWPIEVIVVLASPTRRIGDFVAGTKVVYSSIERNDKAPVSFKSVVISVAFGFLIMFAFTKMFSGMTGKDIFKGPEYVETSYNKELSSQMENVVNNSHPEYLLDSHIQVYDEIENDTVKYVAATFYLTENYIDRDSEFTKIKDEIFNSMFEVIPKEEFILFGKFIYRGPSSMKSTGRNYDWRE